MKVLKLVALLALFAIPNLAQAQPGALGKIESYIHPIEDDATEGGVRYVLNLQQLFTTALNDAWTGAAMAAAVNDGEYTYMLESTSFPIAREEAIKKADKFLKEGWGLAHVATFSGFQKYDRNTVTPMTGSQRAFSQQSAE